MKLISLHIENLYGCYNYDVDFNSDVTFIYGLNGCGKTTILNITEAIITGQLYKLFSYDFTKVELTYEKSQKQISDKSLASLITIKCKSRGFLNIVFEKEIHDLVENFSNESHRDPERTARNMTMHYFTENTFLRDIKKTFNYVYLPLNRLSYSYDFESDRDYYLFQRHQPRYELDMGSHIESSDLTLTQVQFLISKFCSEMNSKISMYSDNFRNKILKSLLEVNQQEPVNVLLQNLLSERNSKTSFKKTKDGYINMLKELSILSTDEESKYNQFFDDFLNELAKKNTSNSSFSFELVTKFQEISKIEKLLKIAQDLEKQKAEERAPLEVFLDTMESFINDSEDDKTIHVDNIGKIYFTTKYNEKKLSIHNLSSGEKQLITFFANLVFGVKSKTSGIFVVDEPELSLHLSWQKIFVEKTLEINDNIQLIFATHAPEIIGSRKDKMFKLEKKYKSRGKKNE